MTVLVPTTQVAVKRLPDADLAAERYALAQDSADFALVVGAERVNANIGLPRSRTKNVGEEQVTENEAQIDFLGLQQWDRVVDLTTNIEYSVLWTRREYRLGLEHMSAGLQVATGVAA